MTRDALMERLGGADGLLVFKGTQVPVTKLFDYLKSGKTIVTFVGDFPSVSREHAVRVLKLSYDLTVSGLK